MSKIAVALVLGILALHLRPPAPVGVGVSASPDGNTYFPIAKGYRWTYKTDYDDDTDIVHEVAGTEKVGEVECFVVEHKSVNAKESRTRVLRKEWLALSDEGVKIHKVQRGRSEMEVEKPFFKLKSELKKDDEWEGEAKASENPPKYHSWVEGETEVEVPAGKYRAVRIRMKVQSGERHSAEGYEWYAKSVGLVKSELTIRASGEGVTIVAELKEFKGAK